jgi:peroxiredoxin
VTWDNVFNGSTSGGIPEEWGISSYPTTYLLDAKGRIRHKNLRGTSVDEKVEELLNEIPQGK